MTYNQSYHYSYSIHESAKGSQMSVCNACQGLGLIFTSPQKDVRCLFVMHVRGLGLYYICLALVLLSGGMG